ncbi:MAG: succinylglutamate-semialdehyde dehydrogenase [Pseudomonadota bacterium]
MAMTGSLYIANEWMKGEGTEFTSLNPATGETLWAGSFAAEEQVSAAIDAAAEAFPAWQRLSVEERYQLIERYSAIAAERKEEMGRLISAETGKALWDAMTEAGAIAGKGAVSLAAYHDRTPTKDEGATRLTHRAHGVMAVIGPFNFPGHLPNGHIIPALIAGNTIVLKPSEITPAVAELMVSWWHEAGLPKGVVNLVHGGAKEANQLITDPQTAAIAFTGGIRAGKAIHQALGGHPEKILALELGGNNPLVAWDVSDAESAATIIARSAYITSGQRCTCTRRLIVEDGPKGQAVIDAVAALIPKLRVDHPDTEPEPFMGPLVHDRAAQAVIDAQHDMVAHGAEEIVRAEHLDLGAAFVSPGLIDTTHWTARADEEVFGPLLQVIRVANFDAAITTANDTRFGLAAGLLSDDEGLWDRFAKDIRAGIVNWNRQTTGASGKAPFGGPGLSGNHRPAGYYAADYCAWPMASMVQEGRLKDEMETKGLIT